MQGESTRDFGQVIFEGKNVELRHEFVLKNTYDRALRIQHVSASCGCASAVASHQTVEPGDSVTVTAVMRLLAPQRRQESVWIDFGKDGVKTLAVSAHVVRATNLIPVHAAVDLRQGPQELSVISTNLQSDDQPDAPTLHTPANVSARFGGWRMICPRDESTGRAAAWIGDFQIVPNADFSGGTAALESPEGASAKIDLAGRPWLPSRLPDRQPDLEVVESGH